MTKPKELPQLFQSSQHPKTYSDVTENSPSLEKNICTSVTNQQNSFLGHFLARQTEKIDILIQQIGTLLNLLTNVISKMIP
jgi:hypothetical protein